MKQVLIMILLLSFGLINAQEVNPCNGIYYGNLSHPDPLNCGQYIFCMMTFANLRWCPPNEVFVPHPNASYHEGQCQPGDPETCEVFTTTSLATTSIDTTEFEDTSETTEEEIDTTTSPEFTTDLFTIQPTTSSRLPTTTPIPIHRCPPGGNGYIPHHTNCNRYFECINGIRQMRFCPDGLLFDSVTLQCTYPEFAVCAGYK